MKGYLKQLLDRDMNNIMLLLCPIDIEDEMLISAYGSWENDEDDSLDFDEWWNEKNQNFQIERVYVEELIVT